MAPNYKHYKPFTDIKEAIQTLFNEVREFSFDSEKTKEVAKRLNLSPSELTKKVKELPEQLAVYGGAIPYMMAGEDSGRTHSDFDIALPTAYQEIFREVSKELTQKGCDKPIYGNHHGNNPEKDPEKLTDITINNITASITTIYTKEEFMNFGINEKDAEYLAKNYFKKYDIDGFGKFKTHSIEVQRMTKEFAITTSKDDKGARGAFLPKDYTDLAYIIKLSQDPKFGYDREKYEKLCDIYKFNTKQLSFDSTKFEQLVLSGEHEKETSVAILGERLLFEQVNHLRYKDEKEVGENELITSASTHFSKKSAEKKETLAELIEAYNTDKVLFGNLMEEAAIKYQEYGGVEKIEKKFFEHLGKITGNPQEEEPQEQQPKSANLV